MAAKKKAAKAGAAAVAVKNSPYVQRVIEDDELRQNLCQAYESARDAAARLGNGKSPTKQIFDDKKLQKDLKNAAESFRDAQRRAARGAQAAEGPELRPPAPADGRQRRHRARRLRGPAQEGARRAVRRRGGVRVHLDDRVAVVGEPPATAGTPAPRAPAAAGCPRGSRPPRRPRSRATVAAITERLLQRVTRSSRALLSGLRRLSIFSIRFSAHSNSSASMPRPTKTIAQPGPGSGTSASPPSDDHEREDHEADPVGLAALEVALAPARELLGQRRRCSGAARCSRQSPAMKSRTSTSAPGRSRGVLAVARQPCARGHVAVLLPCEQDRMRIDRVLSSPPGWISKCDVRRGRLGVAGVAGEAEHGAGLDAAAVVGVGGEGGEVGVEERVAGVGVRATGGCRRSAACRRGSTVPSATASTGAPKGAKTSLPSWAPVSARAAPKSSATVGLAVDGERVALAGEALARPSGRLAALGLLRLGLRLGRGGRGGRRRGRWGWRRRRRRRVASATATRTSVPLGSAPRGAPSDQRRARRCRG